MLGKRKRSRSERTFSMMLAEELLRAELKKLYGDSIQFCRCDIEADPVTQKLEAGQTATDREALGGQFHESNKERLVHIVAIVGPFEELHAGGEACGDKRRKLRKVVARCRMWSHELAVAWWNPHFIEFMVWDQYGRQCNFEAVFYDTGVREGIRHEKTADNPCEIICASQVGATYAGMNTPAWGPIKIES